MKKLFMTMVLGCATSLFFSGAMAQTKIKIGLSTPMSALQPYYLYGQQIGLYAEEGLEAEFVSVAGAGILLPQLANKALDFALANPDLPLIALDKGEPYPIKFVYNFYTSQLFEFAVLDSSPVKTLADLKGKKIGVGALSWSNLPMSRAMLQDAGVSWQKDVQTLPVGVGPAAWSRLTKGDIDALNLWNAQHGLLAYTGVKVRRLPTPEKFSKLFANGWATHNDTVQDRPELVEKFGRVLIKSVLACRANIEECTKSYWQYSPASKPTPEKEAAWVAQYSAVNADDIEIILAAAVEGRYGEYPAAAWQTVAQILADAGLIKSADLPLDTLYTNQFVDAYNK